VGSKASELEVAVDLFSTMRVFGRRWYALAPVLLLAIVAEMLLPGRIPVSYRWNASILLVPPSTDGAASRASNPYLNFDQSLIVAANVIARSVSDSSSVDRLARTGARAHFTVTPPVSDVPNPSPIVEVVVQDTDEQLVTSTAARVVQAVQDSLRSQQRDSGAPAASLIQAVVVSRSAKPVAVLGNRHRAMAAIAALAVALMTGAAFLAEAFAVRRGRRIGDRVSPTPAQVRVPPILIEDLRGIHAHGH